MSEAARIIHNTQTTGLSLPQPPSLELVPVIPEDPTRRVVIDYFRRGILFPLTDYPQLTNGEISLIKRQVGAVISTHIVSSVLLHCAGDKTTIKEYDTLTTAQANSERIKALKLKPKKEFADAEETAVLAEVAAMPYVSVLTHALPYASAYQEHIAQIKGEERANYLEAKIYGPSEDFVHPGLDEIIGARGIFGNNSIEAERIMRLILIGNLPGRQATEADA